MAKEEEKKTETYGQNDEVEQQNIKMETMTSYGRAERYKEEVKWLKAEDEKEKARVNQTQSHSQSQEIAVSKTFLAKAIAHKETRVTKSASLAMVAQFYSEFYTDIHFRGFYELDEKAIAFHEKDVATALEVVKWMVAETSKDDETSKLIVKMCERARLDLMRTSFSIFMIRRDMLDRKCPEDVEVIKKLRNAQKNEYLAKCERFEAEKEYYSLLHSKSDAFSLDSAKAKLREAEEKFVLTKLELEKAKAEFESLSFSDNEAVRLDSDGNCNEGGGDGEGNSNLGEPNNGANGGANIPPGRANFPPPSPVPKPMTKSAVPISPFSTVATATTVTAPSPQQLDLVEILCIQRQSDMMAFEALRIKLGKADEYRDRFLFMQHLYSIGVLKDPNPN